MMSEDNELSDRPSPMLYDGGIRIEQSASSVPAHTGNAEVPAGNDEAPAGILDKREADKIHARARPWDHYRDHPPIMCPQPRLATGLRNRAVCPFCGERGVMLAGERTLREYGYDAADTMRDIIAEALHQIRSIFRRHAVSLETTNARSAVRALKEEWDYHKKIQCSQCSDAAGCRRWDALCRAGAELRGLLVDAKADLARQVELDKHPAPGQIPMF